MPQVGFVWTILIVTGRLSARGHRDWFQYNFSVEVHLMASARTVASGLAWFGIALGAAELLTARRVASAAGLEGHESLIRLFGAREIASGALILNSDQPA